MKLRDKQTGIEYTGDRFNLSGLGEIIVGNEHGQDSAFQWEFDVWLEAKQEWKDLDQAFRDHDVISDNLNTRFFEPQTPADRERGYSLY